MAGIDKVRIILVGDSVVHLFGFHNNTNFCVFLTIIGVGKTSLTSLIAKNEPLTSPGWTIGCSVEVKFHEYKEGTPSQNSFFIELWDIGGSISHQNTRGVLYYPSHGIILVHDLTNRKSHDNLQKWLCEILSKDGKDSTKGNNDVDFDPEQFLGSTQIPILVIGTKLDLLDDYQKKKYYNSNSIAQQLSADEININCHDQNSLAPGTSNAVKLSRFFDKVIERKHYSRDTSARRYTSSYISPLITPYTSPSFGGNA